MNYRETEWAKMWENICPEAYDLAMEVAEHPELQVNVYKVEDLWVIEPRNIVPDFWLDAHYTRQKAIDQCFEMGWYIR